MTNRSTLWLKAAYGFAAAVLLGIAAVNLAAPLWRQPPVSSYLPAPDAASATERRLADLHAELDRRSLPGTIGYKTDGPAGMAPDAPEAVQAYFLAQYALAPRVLDRDLAAQRYCVQLALPAGRPSAIPAGWRLLAQCGDGVLLLERQP